MPTVAFRTAIRDALDEELAADERVILFGEDVAVAGGVFATTTGLYDKYGPDRVFDTPISELALAGAAFGSAVTGLRPVIEIMKKVDTVTATAAGTTGKWVDRNAATIEQHIIIVKILIRPNRSASRPTPFIVKSVAPPPIK